MPLISGGGGSFNGGTITGPLSVIVTGDGDTPIYARVSATSFARVLDLDAVDGNMHYGADGTLAVGAPSNGSQALILRGSAADTDDIVLVRTGGNKNVLTLSGGNKIGFYDHAPATQQMLHSATVTPEQIALALEANGLCGGD